MTGEQARAKLASARRIVVKVGTAVVTRPGGGMALARLGGLVEQLAALRADGREVLLVSSGAVGLGAQRLGFASKPVELVDRQACAAAGQGALMALYEALAQQVGLRTAQVLLTEADLDDRRRYLHLAATLQRLLELGALPILNENDVVSAAEIALQGKVFGDNDRLSALVAGGLGADALVLLTEVDAVMTAPPGTPGATPVATWSEHQSISLGPVSAGGRGGMGAKIDAARVAARAGCTVVIASGFRADALPRVLAGEPVGTLFPPDDGVSRRQHWLAFAAAPRGRLIIDDGARQALVARGSSLLLPGVTEVLGDFDAGAAVEIVDAHGVIIARGLCARAASDVRSALGQAGERGKPLVHRDQVVLLVDPPA